MKMPVGNSGFRSSNENLLRINSNLVYGCPGFYSLFSVFMFGSYIYTIGPVGPIDSDQQHHQHQVVFRRYGVHPEIASPYKSGQTGLRDVSTHVFREFGSRIWGRVFFVAKVG